MGGLVFNKLAQDIKFVLYIYSILEVQCHGSLCLCSIKRSVLFKEKKLKREV